MNYKPLTNQEMASQTVGGAVTIVTVMTVALIAIMTAVFFQLMMSKKGTVTVPGGWKFTWN